MDLSVIDWSDIWQATLETLTMTGLSLLFTILIGLPLGILLFLTGRRQLLAQRGVNELQVEAGATLSGALLRNGLKLFETWYDTSSGCLDIPLTAFYGSEDPLATANHMLNWREFTGREFELIEVAGNHFFIKSQRQRLLQVINTHLGLLGEHLT